jgi:hypothetical protein
MLEAVRAAQDMPHWVAGTVPLHIVVLLAGALEGYAVKPGRFGTLYICRLDDTYAMVDTGPRVKVAKTDQGTIRAALAVAAGKWQTLTLGGSDEFKAAVVRESGRWEGRHGCSPAANSRASARRRS